MMSTDLQNLAGLVEQIKAAAPAAEAGPSATAAAADSEDVRALRSELDSVRQELRRAVAPRSNAGDTAGSAAGLPFLRQLACGQMFAMHAFRKSAGDDAGPVHGAGPHRATHAAQRVLAANPQSAA